MSEIYVYGPNDDSNDYSTMGLVGALLPTECKFREAANGDSSITLVHPLDPFGRYLNLEKGNILSVPVPVRTTPEIQNGSCVTTVWTYKVKPLEQLTSKYQRTLYKRKSGSSRLKIMKPGDILTIVLRPDDSGDDGKRWKAKTEYGTGWINPDGIELVTQHLIPDNSGGIMEIRSPWKVTNQLFRIYESQKTLDKITVQARHISYDLLYNMTRYSSEEAALLQDAIDGVLNNCYAEHGFNGYTNVVNEQPGLFYKRKNPIEAFLNPEEGICKRFNVGLVRDNYDLYFLHDPGTNRGIRVQYRKNMTGINFASSDDEVVTRIIPIGETKDGSDLFLTDDDDPTGHYIDSPNISAYPIVHVHELKCENCKVNDKEDEGGKITTEIARARMREQAQKLLDAKCDQPTIDMGVEFVNLGDTEEYKHLKDLENCFLYDYIIVQHPDLAIDVTAQIMEIEWDCLMERMIGVQIGSVGKTLANMGITTWQIPTGFSGSKIAGGTVGNAALQSDIISVRHMQSDSVNTDALMAKSVSAEKIDTDSLFADEVYADKLYAKVGEFVKIVAGNIEADKIDVDVLTANIVKSIQVSALMADFDKATVKNLVAQALFLEYGNGDEVHIKNLSVDYAQMVGATIGKLCIKSSDGKYYNIDVNADGSVTATDVSEEIGDTGVNGALTPDGKRVIVETSMTVDDLNAGTFQAIYALINKLDAAMIDTDELIAREAFIQKLVTAEINSSGDTIEIIAKKAAQGNVYTGDNPPANPAEGQLWVDTGVDPTVLRNWMGYDIDADREIPAGKLTADVITFDAATSQGDIEYSTKFEPYQEGEGDPYPAGGSEQLYKYAISGTVRVYSGLTLVFDDDGCVVNGTPINDYAQVFTINDFPFEVGDYYVSGGDVNKYYLQVAVARNGVTRYYSNVKFTIYGDETATAITLQSSTKANTGTLSNYRIKPMLIKGDKAPTEYKPYSNIRPVHSCTKLDLTNCGKNLLQNSSISKSVDGVTFTVNTDGSIVANGTATADAVFMVNEKIPLKSGKYIISGCPSDGGIGKYSLCCYNRKTNQNIISDNESGISVNFSNDTKYGYLSDYTSEVYVIPSGLTFGIVKHPANVSVFVGATVTFSVEAQGNGLSYRWQFKNADGIWQYSSMTGSNTPNISLEATAARNGYQYRCVVTDENGEQLISNPAALTANVIDITKQPENVIVSLGSEVLFSVSASGNGLSYRWQFKMTYDGWADSTMGGHDTPSLKVAAETHRNGYRYRCVITDANNNQVVSSEASLTIGETSLTLADSIDAPSNVFALSVDATSIRLLWNPVENASGYKIYRSTTANGSFSEVTSIDDSETTEWIDTGLATGTTYYYRVMAIASGGYFNTSIVIFSGFTASNLTFYPMIRLASEEDGTYEPYLGNTYTVQLGDTIYGGSYNWKTGLLTVDRKMAVIDGSTPIAAGYIANHGYRYQRYPLDNDMILWSDDSTVPEGLFCDALRTVSGDALYNTTPNSVCLATTVPSIKICVAGLTTKAEYTEWLNATPITVVYPLAEPFTIQYDPQKIELPESEKVTAFSTPGETSILSKISGWDTITADTVALEEMMAEAVLDINSDIENLQSQIDGNITSWFYKYSPTLENEPASKWTDDAAKNNHLGDLFYDETTGYCYRFQLSDGVYGWKLIQDTDIAKALADAKNAQDTADNKRRVFYNIPTPPYDPGDLWVQGKDGDILRCCMARAAGVTDYDIANDWVKASKYTDDTKADEAYLKAEEAANKSLEATTIANQKVKSIDIEYAKGDSPEKAPTTGWGTDFPEWESGKYIWSRTKYTLGNGNVNYSNSTCLTTANRSIDYVEEQFYLSTSKDSPSDGEWLAAPPAWVTNTYLFIRFVIHYSDGTTLEQEPMLDETWSSALETLKVATAAKDQADFALEEAKKAVLLPDFERVVRIKTDGLHIGDNKTTSEVLIDSATVNVVINGTTYSTFGPNFLQLGDDIRVRRPSVGGIAFSPIIKKTT